MYVFETLIFKENSYKDKNKNMNTADIVNKS